MTPTPDPIAPAVRQPLREFESETAPHTREMLEKARVTLVKGQARPWLLDDPPTEGFPHKTPCFPIRDVEWLFGYVDAALDTIEALTAERDEALLDAQRLSGIARAMAFNLDGMKAQVAILTEQRDRAEGGGNQDPHDYGAVEGSSAEARGRMAGCSKWCEWCELRAAVFGGNG